IRAAEGRAFCAGGDLKSAYERMIVKDIAARVFFRDEYQLNRLIFHFRKPYIALLDGITMGGGVGISIHGSHRVATDRLVFAMPETGIGFFPDVGGTYFLPRLPARLGFYLGLTGARLMSDDCVALGIATQKVASESLAQIITALAEEKFTENAKASVSAVLQSFTVAVHPTHLMEQQAALMTCFSLSSIEAILSALQGSPQTLCQEAISAIAKKSPTSLKVTLRALQNGAQLAFDACMRQEYRLVCRFLEAYDFSEGIRALIIDKDQVPQWKPSSLEKVTESEIEKYFDLLPEER
ncbi:MAG: enoyl-CoA hydratase/isomerase family protein, partial [Gammaproteobacteria bacterium]|nr:enoyl-CoA hydratase/isomerase family protein [Gammaproteobacteria bacterium]